MNATTANRMNFLLKRNTERINLVVPSELKKEMVKAEKELDMNESQFIKLCIIEKLDRLEAENQ
ncbi:hypothetical protein [uncultured Sunxiuqinia sp.]|uniref:hypothetical protein n=1 Tax=uncultured Sunxiuqinia sp. TaxID=1573825 RepID=UPI002624F27D|nr:hypothetical protein [uncultured Sunxiuqinia sp.]